MPILLHESDVERLLSMPEAVAAVERMFREMGEGQVLNIPRRRTRLPNGMMHVMAAANPALGYLGLKCYTVFQGKARFVVLLFSSQTGELLAILEADTLGQRRTGAASGVATKYMARADARVVGIYGTGWQARSQLAAVAAVRRLERVYAYGRNAERRATFAREMSEGLGVEVVPVDRPEAAAEGADILVTITSAREPVLKGEWIGTGVHVNAAGSNSLIRREIDEETVRRMSRIVTDDLEQTKIEGGDLLPSVERGQIHWGQVHGLAEVVAGYYPGRADVEENTLFNSLGLAAEDIAAAAVVYEKAVAQGIGERVPMFE
ncbi:MAG: ornithine cyclodeaminase family protein [Anaerolineae bacterium]